MPQNSEAISYYLGAIRRGDKGEENAIHRLVELGDEVIPFLSASFATEKNPDVRATLLRVARMTNAPASLSLFAQALEDWSPTVWKGALDGLVAAANSEALLIAQHGKGRADAQKGEWIDEAIDQIQEAMRLTTGD